MVVAALVLEFLPQRRAIPGFGVYAGPGSKGVAGAANFVRSTRVPVTHVLDFASADNWQGVTGPPWLLDAHAKRPARLEYSLPMFPEGSANSLARCATGDYNDHWQTLAENLVAAGLSATIVRPGWEFNGDWYAWSAAGHVHDYAKCFRAIVTTMRLVVGQHFAFDWNPTLGHHAMAAERAYPGDSYVSYIGVDAYDTSPIYRSAHGAAAAAQAWQQIDHGDHGLAFWARFAARHAKPLVIPEWGVTSGSDAEGGGDDPAYVDHMFTFMTDPDNHVAYEQYFDGGSSFAEHRLDGHTQFPKSKRSFDRWMQTLTK